MSKPSKPFVPVYVNETIVGRAYDLAGRQWAGRMSDGTRVGFHPTFEATRQAILARHAKVTPAGAKSRRVGSADGRNETAFGLAINRR